MDLRKEDVAKLLTVSKQTIDRLIEEGNLPAYTLGGELRFNRSEIENWIVKTSSVEKDILPFGEEIIECSPWQQFGLYRAIHKGDVIINTSATTKEEVIKDTMITISERLSFDPEVVIDLLLERENLMSTALSNGIAVPHTREFLLEGLFDAVVVVYPKEAINWCSLDGKPVHTLFFLFACDDKRHLNLLAKIAHFSSLDESMELIQSKPSKVELLDYIKKWETKISIPNADAVLT